jgi:prophage DNA circulation protein
MRYKAKIDNYDIDIDAISDSFTNSVVKNEYPFSDGASLDYMGEGAREITFNVYFFKRNYSTHDLFLSHIRSGKIYELSHPVYGLIKGRIQNPKVEHDNRIDFCIVSITFMEQKIGDEVPTSFSVKLEIESLFVNMQVFTPRTLYNILPKSVVTKQIDKTKSLFSQFASFSSSIRSKIAQIDNALLSINNFYNQVELPIESVINLVTYGSTIPDLIFESTINAVGRCAEAVKKTVGSPSIFINTLKNNSVILARELESVLDNDLYQSLRQCTEIASAEYGSVIVSQYYSDDENLRNEYDFEATKQAFDIEGNRINTVKTISLYNQNELEKSLYTTREILQVSMDYDRDNLVAHKEIAHTLEKHVQSIKLKRDKQISIDVGLNEKPLHLVCRENGLSHYYDTKIMAINNNIPNPFFCSGNIIIYEKGQ